MTATDYKGPQRRQTRRRVRARADDSRNRRLRKWAASALATGMEFPPTHKQIARDLLDLLDEQPPAA